MRRLKVREVRPRKLAPLALIWASALLENDKGVRRFAPAFMREPTADFNCRSISQNFSSTGVTSSFVAQTIPTDAVAVVPVSGQKSERLPARAGKSRLRQAYVAAGRDQRSGIRKFLCRWEAVVQLGTSSPDRLDRRQSLPGNV